MIELPQHDLRAPLTDELHARPFMPLEPPTRVAYFAFLPEAGDARHSAEQDLAHLNALLEHLGEKPVDLQPDGRAPLFHLGEVEGCRFKWERHSEFVTFMFSFDRPGDQLFVPQNKHLVPPAWMKESRLRSISSSMVEILPASDAEAAERVAVETLAPCFNRDSLAFTWVTARAAIAISDFRIDENGFTRFGVVALDGQVGPRRLGRLAQRLIEMETYRIMAMVALPLARRLGPELTEIETRLGAITRGIAEAAGADVGDRDPLADKKTLTELTSLSADLEKIAGESAYRFGAARAYEQIVYERIEALREQQFGSRQTYAEFMARRFKPALRTVHSVHERLNALSTRGERAANLLRTRIDVALETQNQQLLKSMDQRARLQLRLQETVEGLSVVAISYYAVSLAGYMLAPLFALGGGDEKIAKAIVALPVIAAVWWMVRRIRKGLAN